jgi:hypothetical protein
MVAQSEMPHTDPTACNRQSPLQAQSRVACLGQKMTADTLWLLQGVGGGPTCSSMTPVSTHHTVCSRTCKPSQNAESILGFV